MNLGEILAQNAIQRRTHIEGRRVDLIAFGPRLGQRRDVTVGPDGQCRNCRLQLAITVLDLGLVEVVEVQRLGQGEDMFVPVIPDQGCLDHLNR